LVNISPRQYRQKFVAYFLGPLCSVYLNIIAITFVNYSHQLNTIHAVEQWQLHIRWA